MEMQTIFLADLSSPKAKKTNKLDSPVFLTQQTLDPVIPVETTKRRDHKIGVPDIAVVNADYRPYHAYSNQKQN